MSEGAKYRGLEKIINLYDNQWPDYEITEANDARAELAAAERTALDYARIDALRLAAEKEVDVLAGELEAARKRIAEMEEFIKRLADADVYAFDGTRDTGMVLIPRCFQAEAVSLALDRGQS